MRKALKRVQENKGAPGIDGITVEELPGYLRKNWPKHREELLQGTYRPKPALRKEIPKPDGGKRNLSIPCVLDRLIQQAVLQVLQERWDPTFSEHSYGFRPGRSQHQAVARAQEYIAAGNRVVVDLDLEKFLDPTKGEMVMNWTKIYPNFPGGIESGVTLTPGHGVWQLNDDGDYDYTWYAYALDNDPGSDDYGKVMGIIRATGVAMLHDPDDSTTYDCDQVYIHYHLSFADLYDQWDFSSVTWQENVINGWAYESRVPLVPSSPEE